MAQKYVEKYVRPLKKNSAGENRTLTTADDLNDNAANIFTTAYSFTAVPNFDAAPNAAHNFTSVPNFAAAPKLTAVPTPNFTASNFTAALAPTFTAVPNFIEEHTVNENSPDIKVEDSTFTVFRKELCELYHRVKIIGVQELTIQSLCFKCYDANVRWKNNM